MGPREDDLEQPPETLPGEKKRRFRLVKLEERRFRMDRVEERIAPTLIGGSLNSGTSGPGPTHQTVCTLVTCHGGHCK